VSELPDIGQTIAPVLLRLPRERQPLLIAVAERMAAERYRAWAAEPANADHERELLACAEREEEIARRIEGLYPDAAALQRAIVGDNPELDEINRAIFAGRPLADQFTIQARGERLGAATWRAFAKHAPNPDARATFLSCARLEEDSAAVLESILAARGGAA
jgi:hypothetical protein